MLWRHRAVPIFTLVFLHIFFGPYLLQQYRLLQLYAVETSLSACVRGPIGYRIKLSTCTQPHKRTAVRELNLDSLGFPKVETWQKKKFKLTRVVHLQTYYFKVVESTDSVRISVPSTQ